MERQVSTYRFGPYELRTGSRGLYKHGTRLRLRPQSSQVLKLLVARAGDVVPRDELHLLLWPTQPLVDFELGLNTCIKELRGVLSDSASEPRYIETLPKLGYRLIVPVEVEQQAPVNEGIVQIQARDSDGVASPRITPKGGPTVEGFRRWALPLGISLVLLTALATYLQWPRSRIRPQPTSGRSMLAVLPLENLTGDPAQDYFSDGLTEEMIARLGRTDPQHIGVIARTSVMHYKHTQERLDQIARELEVQYVLEGSVRRDSGKVRITAQLIQVKDQTHIWSRQYDRELSNLLTLQGEIAQEIAGEIQLTLGDQKLTYTAPPAYPLAPKSYEAYDLYLKGRYFWNKRTPQGFQQAIECFEQAVTKDPNYARAYAGLADSYALMSAYDVAPPSELIPKARTAAVKALELDEKLAEAHVSLGVIAQNYDWDWQTAEMEYRRAIELDPNYATGHHWYAEHLALLGRFDDAFPEMRRAIQLDPLSLIIHADNGAILYFSRQYDPAVAQFRAVLEMEPNFPRANMVGFAHAQKGQFADALADIESWLRVGNNPVWVLSLQAYVYGLSGQQGQARHAVEKLELLNRHHQIDPFAFVGPYIGLGDKDQAFVWLDKSVTAHAPGLTALKVDPIYDPLRSDPRFQPILRRLGLAQ